MFKKMLNVVGGFVSCASRKVKIFCAVCLGAFLAANVSAQSALDGFIATDANGDPTADPSKITDLLKQIVVLVYSNWMTLALIFVIVGIITYILWKRK